MPTLTSSAALDMEQAERLFASLCHHTTDAPGITRDTYGAGENVAHDLMAATARDLGLQVTTDAAGNLYMTLLGRDPSAPQILLGSHLDSVPHGGNYDGAAGVVAGLVLLARLKRLGRIPTRSITVMGCRAEELCWFPAPYIGSRAAFGLIPPALLDELKRSDTGQSLAEHMSAAGFHPERLRQGEAHLKPEAIHCYLELHIEQGPALVDAGIPVGIVTGIRGNLRYRHCRIQGRYAHAGAVPRHLRQDAVLAGAEFVTQLERYWLEQEQKGIDFVATVGQFSTDAEHHTLTKVPGVVEFTLDIRSEDNQALLATDRYLRRVAAEIGQRRGVRIDLGEYTNALPGLMDVNLCQRLTTLAQQQGIPTLAMASGAGHDCAVFANQGIPTAMVFVRNENGSHNADEAMDMADFALGCQLLAALVDELME
ncbi:MAG: Zn-dependent hydrolase [Thermostichus sp. BF3_bins_97]